MTTLRIFGKGFNYSQDGPGNRLVYHLQGCNLHCPWCSNPEGMNPRGSLVYNQRTPLLDSFCPYGAVQNGTIDRERCQDCARPCADLHTGALSRSETIIEADTLIAEVLRSRAVFFEGGGVTFTGGEATLQSEALHEIMIALKKEEIHIALETNGTHPRLPELFPLVDYLIMDVKHADPQKFTQMIGHGFAQFQKNLQAAAKRDQLALRIPLIHGFNSEERDVKAMGTMIAALNAPAITVELLRYHEYGKDKWQQIGLPYTMTNGHVSDEEYRQAHDILRGAGLQLIHT